VCALGLPGGGNQGSAFNALEVLELVLAQVAARSVSARGARTPASAARRRSRRPVRNSASLVIVRAGAFACRCTVSVLGIVLAARGPGERDVVVGTSAGATTPNVLGALDVARARAATVMLAIRILIGTVRRNLPNQVRPAEDSGVVAVEGSQRWITGRVVGTARRGARSRVRGRSSSPTVGEGCAKVRGASRRAEWQEFRTSLGRHERRAFRST